MVCMIIFSEKIRGGKFETRKNNDKKTKRNIK